MWVTDDMQLINKLTEVVQPNYWLSVVEMSSELTYRYCILQWIVIAKWLYFPAEWVKVIDFLAYTYV